MENKTCYSCKISKNILEFGKRKSNKDGYNNHCKECVNLRDRTYLGENEKARNAAHERTRQWHLNNKEKSSDGNIKWKEENKGLTRIFAYKTRAKKLGVPFNLEVEDLMDVPDYCPILGIKLNKDKVFAKDHSISLDRIIPELGYVKGNVQFISFLANRMKNNASFSQLLKFADWIRINIPKDNLNDE